MTNPTPPSGKVNHTGSNIVYASDADFCIEKINFLSPRPQRLGDDLNLSCLEHFDVSRIPENIEVCGLYCSP